MIENTKLKKFSLNSTAKKTFQLNKLKNNLIIFIYPKDNTPGCTLESLDFKKKYNQFKKYKTDIVGISKDSIESHKKFQNKYNFPFELLSDEDIKVIKMLKAWGEKKLYGKKFMGVKRTTILVNKKLKILKIWNNVKVKGHVERVLDFVKNIKE
tara:strand:+ start:21090 stop:21551 length:462 start_codon:yes stop_codon:yes gene_type:complete